MRSYDVNICVVTAVGDHRVRVSGVLLWPCFIRATEFFSSVTWAEQESGHVSLSNGVDIPLDLSFQGELPPLYICISYTI